MLISYLLGKTLERQKKKIAESELRIYEAQKLLDKNGVVVTKTDDDYPRRNLVLTARKKTFGMPKPKNKTGEKKELPYDLAIHSWTTFRKDKNANLKRYILPMLTAALKTWR